MSNNDDYTKSKPPDPKISYAAKAKGGMSENVRMYADIVMKEKKDRAMIEIKFVKKQNDEDKGRTYRNIEIETVSDYIFSHLKVDPKEIQEIDLNTGRQDTKQILFKKGVDIEKYLNEFPDTYLDFYVTVSKMTQNEKKVTFKNVPMYVHDAEIKNLCAVYDEVVSNVER